MGDSSQGRDRYLLSFTTGNLMAREAIIAVPLYLETRDWMLVRKRMRADNLLQTRTATSGLKLVLEVTKRLAMLSDSELEMLHDSSPSERGHFMWVAACRRYVFIGDFAEEVVRERFLLLTPTLSYEDFDSFVRGKALWHPELTEVKDSTMQKLRSTVFQMLTEAGLLVKGEIANTALTERVWKVLDSHVPSDLRFFPTRDIKELSS